MKNIKRLSLILLIGIIAILVNSGLTVVFAQDDVDENAEQNLQDTIFSQISALDFSGFDDVLNDLDFDSYAVFENMSFKDKVNSIITGEFKEGYDSIFKAVLGIFIKNIAGFVPIFATIISIGVMSSFITNLTPNSKNTAITDIVHFVCYSLIIIIIFKAVVNVISLTGQTLSSLKTQIDLVFPLLLTIMTALGSVVSVSVYQPAVAIFSSGIIELFNSIIMPLFIFTLVFAVVGNISSNIKLKKFSNLFNSSFKWIVGSTFTIFMGFMSIQGITAGSYDKVSIRTAKFAMRSYIPIVGGYLSEGFNVIMASGVLVKNSVGLAGLVLMFATILAPVIQILVLKFALNLSAAILEPIVDKRISDFIMSVSKTLVMLLATILAVAFMYFIMVGLIISTGNIV
jgi:stage III sporulation protein AE